MGLYQTCSLGVTFLLLRSHPNARLPKGDATIFLLYFIVPEAFSLLLLMLSNPKDKNKMNFVAQCFTHCGFNCYNLSRSLHVHSFLFFPPLKYL